MEHRSDMIRPGPTPRVFPAVLVVLLLTFAPVAAEGSLEVTELHVISSHSHDEGAFTQGLEMHEGSLYESTGLYGSSSLREVDPSSGEVLRQTQLDQSLFGEGITIVGDTIVMLTWREEIALVFDIVTLEVIANHAYSGEGWGLCYDGNHLVMSNGTSGLTFRNPSDFSVEATLLVTDQGIEVDFLNELECVGQTVYANVWGKDSIIAINKTTGEVESTIDASVLAENESGGYNDVLNGIAYFPERDAFLITGKNWTSMHLVSFENSQTPSDDNTSEPLPLSIPVGILPVLLIAALVIILSSMRLLSTIIRFFLLIIARRQTEKPSPPTDGRSRGA
jgi:glutamine cyclotransferase